MGQKDQERWVTEQNIARFKDRLKVADNILEKMLQGLIILEEQKLKSLAPPLLANSTIAQAMTVGEKFLHEFAAQTPIAMAMFDDDMRYLALSERWRSDYGLGESLIGESHYEVFPEISGQWKEVHQRALSGETVGATYNPFERLDGSVQWLNWQVRP